MILGVDPGTRESAVVVYNEEQRVPVFARHFSNETMLDYLLGWKGDPKQRHPTLVIEGMTNRGQRAGFDVFMTCEWIGRFGQAYGEYHKLTTQDIRLHLAGKRNADNAALRAILIDRFGPGKDRAIGLKKSPGPLYGIKSHMWSALAVCVVWAEQRLDAVA